MNRKCNEALLCAGPVMAVAVELLSAVSRLEQLIAAKAPASKLFLNESPKSAFEYFPGGDEEASRKTGGFCALTPKGASKHLTFFFDELFGANQMAAVAEPAPPIVDALSVDSLD